MTIAQRSHDRTEAAGARLYRFTVDEYRRLADADILHQNDPIELIDGVLSIKSDVIPPYGVPVGIPPDYLLSDRALWGRHPMRRLTADEYERVVKNNVLDQHRRHELLEGWVIEKMTHKPRHDFILSSATETIERALPPTLFARVQMGLALDESTPEPDLAIVLKPRANYRERHPSPHEVKLIVEVSDATLAYDLGMKLRSYARNAIAQYWVLDAGSEQLHVFSDPSGPTDSPTFAQQRTLQKDQRVAVQFTNDAAIELSVADLFDSPG